MDAVSYTHLDVYKRQLRSCACAMPAVRVKASSPHAAAAGSNLRVVAIIVISSTWENDIVRRIPSRIGKYSKPLAHARGSESACRKGKRVSNGKRLIERRARMERKVCYRAATVRERSRLANPYFPNLARNSSDRWRASSIAARNSGRWRIGSRSGSVWK